MAQTMENGKKLKSTSTKQSLKLVKSLHFVVSKSYQKLMQMHSVLTYMGGRIGVLTVLEGSTDEAAAKDVAMHIAAVNPKYIDRDAVTAEEVEHERQVLTQQALNEGKPEKSLQNG